ncbi:MAG: redoxin domain-containing protein [Acidobacteria bacterium]|nr:redoxin domain-containing protein [Acidobacteriota bacterium]MCL5289088.1 redoxin domain-containing protein [Acidobacteriota bacterium]
MLKLRQIIPPLTARAADGRVVQAWDFKQKHSLAIVFLHAGCRCCADYLERLRENAAELKEREAVALVIFSETPAWQENLPAQIMVAADVSGKSQRAFLGEDAFDPAGQSRVGVFVTDRYGELRAQWSGPHEDALPQPGEILEWLNQIQMACEECFPPEWKLES